MSNVSSPCTVVLNSLKSSVQTWSLEGRIEARFTTFHS